MSAFMLAFFATALVIAAGRDAVFVARLSQAHGRAPGLHLAIAIAAAVFAALSVWLAGSVAPLLAGAPGRLFVAIALLVAGGEVLLLRAGAAPAEPTHSTAATAIVLAAKLLFGASGFLLLALAARATALPAFTAGGGALGAIAVLSAAAATGADWERLPMAILRVGVGVALFAAGLIIGLIAIS